MRCIDFGWTKYYGTDGLGCGILQSWAFMVFMYRQQPSKSAALNFNPQPAKQKAKMERDGTPFIKPPYWPVI